MPFLSSPLSSPSSSSSSSSSPSWPSSPIPWRKNYSSLPLPGPGAMTKTYFTPRRRLRNTIFQLTGFLCAIFLLACPIPFLPSLTGSITNFYELVLSPNQPQLPLQRIKVFPTDVQTSATYSHTAPTPVLGADDLPPDAGEGGTDVQHLPREAYVTFLSSISDAQYLQATRLMIYQLLHDPTTADSTRARDLVILTTAQIPPEIQAELREEGAEVRQVELLDGFPIPSEIKDGGNHHWKDQYTKLHIFNMTTYDRVLYLDNDVLLLHSLENIWDSPGSEVVNGLGGIGERRKDEMIESDERSEPSSSDDERSYLNAGFMMLRPDRRLFDILTKVRDYSPFYMEQALLNQYFDWEGDHPWSMLGPKFISHFPKASDVEAGYHALHAKMWKDPVDETVKSVWRNAAERMEVFWAQDGIER